LFGLSLRCTNLVWLQAGSVKNIGEDTVAHVLSKRHPYECVHVLLISE